MNASAKAGSLSLNLRLEQWPLAVPFRIAGYTWEFVEVLLVTVEKDGAVGRGEAAGVYYKADKPTAMLQQLEQMRATIEAGVTRDDVQSLLRPGGARNALNCALWDLEAQLHGKPVWELAGLPPPHPVVTTFTCGAEDPDRMARTARSYRDARAIKLKLTGEPLDTQRVRAVREARPDVWLGVDANQAFSRPFLNELLPVLLQTKVALIEQPFPVGEESWLDGLSSPIPIAADESVQSLEDMSALAGRFNVVNIKLDKCGGLTEALGMARQARALGIEPMVGNMIGTSLAMAPACVVAQLCSISDLDGPIFLQRDREPPVSYTDGVLTCPGALWGGLR